MKSTINEKLRNIICKEAVEVAKYSYSPYSKFRVGSAVLTKGGIYTGVNIENSSYGLSLCAERTALAKAITNGERDIIGIAIACIDAKKDEDNIQEYLPCGACRQWIVELSPNMEIIICGINRIFTINELMPNPFNIYHCFTEKRLTRSKAE